MFAWGQEEIKLKLNKANQCLPAGNEVEITKGNEIFVREVVELYLWYL